MRRSVQLLACLASALALLVVYIGPSPGRAAEPGRLYFLGIAHDSDPPEGKSTAHFDYAPDNFSSLLVAHTDGLFSEVRVTNLKGAAAAPQAIAQKLRQLQKAARSEDLFVLYWGTHGATGRKGWGGSVAGGDVSGNELRGALAAFRCPVIAIVSTCGSGGFARPRSEEIPLPANVTALCACRRRKSTGNELDVALCEALAGFADRDENGQVTLREALDYVPRRYREWLSEEDKNDADLLPVLVHSEASPLDLPLAQAAPERLAVVQDGQWYGALRVGTGPQDKPKVRFLGYDNSCGDGGYSMVDALVDEDQIDLPGAPPALEVLQGGARWPARVVSRSAEGTRVHYIGYPDSDDETVTKDRIRIPFCGADRPDAGGRAAERPIDDRPKRGRRKKGN